MSPPQRRPAIRSVSFEEAGEAIARLIVVAGSDTGQASRAADFLLAWWDGGEWGHFPILHLCNCDAVISGDMLIVMAYLAAEPRMAQRRGAYPQLQSGTAKAAMPRNRKEVTEIGEIGTVDRHPRSLRLFLLDRNEVG